MDQVGLRSVRDLYAKAEQRLKVIEARGKSGLEIPSVNQLRYAGYHILAYVVDGQTPDLEKAKGHCQRAIYDAYEMELSFYIDVFKEFSDEFNDLPVADTVPEYLQWLEAHQEAQTLVRSRRQADGRESYYAQLEPHIEALSAIERHLPPAREQLARKRAINERNERFARVGIWLAAAAVVLGSAFWLFPEVGRGIGISLQRSISPQPSHAPVPAPPAMRSWISSAGMPRNSASRFRCSRYRTTPPASHDLHAVGSTSSFRAVVLMESPSALRQALS